MEKDIRYVRSAIEDLAFTIRSSRETTWGKSPHIVGDVVLSTTLPEDQRHGAIRGTEARMEEMGCKGAEFRAAEKGGEGMA
jgi:hypothetical protein